MFGGQDIKFLDGGGGRREFIYRGGRREWWRSRMERWRNADRERHRRRHRDGTVVRGNYGSKLTQYRDRS